MNMEKCASSWAIAIAQSMSDRICISTLGVEKTQLSSQYLISCYANSEGNNPTCNGGAVSRDVLSLYANEGIPSEQC
jgi:cathepsin B